MPDPFAQIFGAFEIDPINLNDFLLGAAWMLALRRQRITTILNKYLPGDFDGDEDSDGERSL